jgi:hypothetical protein
MQGLSAWVRDEEGGYVSESRTAMHLGTSLYANHGARAPIPSAAFKFVDYSSGSRSGSQSRSNSSVTPFLLGLLT